MLGYEWANPEAMLLSSDLSAEEAALEQTQQHLRHYPPYDRGSLGLASMFSPLPPPPVTVAALPGEEGYSLHHRGLLLPPAAAQLQAGGATRIGLNLGERTYFSASHDGDLMQLLGGNALWRPGGVPDVGEGGVYDGLSGNDGLLYTSRARCQADGCVADLAKAKQYHRRHKVCEYHSKAAAVVTDGLTQRFCQQCSRFHLLLEFDHGKRSCRKRLAEHNRRRRKYPPSPAMLPPSPTHPNPTTSSTTLSPPNPTSEDPVVEGPQPSRCGESTATMAATVAPPASPTRMATGLCLGYQQLDGVPGASSSLSTSSPPSCSSSPSWSSSSSVLQHVPQFRPYPPWVSMSLWEAEVTDEYLN